MFEQLPGSDEDWMAIGIVGVIGVVVAFLLAAAVGGNILLAIVAPTALMLGAALVLGLRQPVESDSGVAR